MIKKEIIINEDIEKIAASEDSQSAVLEAAYRKRLELKMSFEKEGSDINRLSSCKFLMKLDQKIAAKKFLNDKNITERKDGHGTESWPLARRAEVRAD
jgi:hypothetical protein